MAEEPAVFNGTEAQEMIKELERQLAETQAQLRELMRRDRPGQPGPAWNVMAFHRLGVLSSINGDMDGLMLLYEMVDNLSDGFFMLDREWRFAFVNQVALQAGGLPVEAYEGKTIWDLWPGLRGTPVEVNYRQAMERGSPSHFEMQGLISGSWYQVHVYPSREGLAVFFVDQNESIRADQALRISEVRFRHLADAMPQLVWTAEPDGHVDYYNRRQQEYRGITETVEGEWQWAPVVHPEDRQRTVDAWRQALERGEMYQIEHRVEMNDGAYRWHLSRGVPARDEQGQVIKWYGTATDIHDNKLDEQALQESEERFRTLADNMAQLAWMADEQGHIFWFNRRWFEYTGTTLDEMAGWGWRGVHHPEHVERVVEKLNRCFQSGEVWEDTFPLRGKDGSYRWFLSRAVPIRDEQGKVIRWFGTNTDVTQQLQVDESLRQSEREFRVIFELANAGKAVYDPQLEQFLRVNRKFCDLSGYSEQELLQMKFWQLTFPEDREKDRVVFQEALDGRAEGWEIEKRFLRRDGSVIWVQVSGSILYDETGQPWRSYAVVQDMTDRKLAEEAVQKYAAELERSNRELEEFAAVASHDLNEPLRKIEAFGSSLLSTAVLDEYQRDYLERMRSAAARMRQMVEGLLALARVTIHGQPFLPVDLSQVAAQVLSDLEVQVRQAGGRVEIGPLPTVEADPIQMRQLLQNLVSNALKFRQPDVAPRVQITSRPIEGGLVEIRVQDNGIGFEAQHSHRLFQPFQRLVGRSQYEGSGMGLALCRKIAERHGGGITAVSEQGQGSTFIVTLHL